MWAMGTLVMVQLYPFLQVCVVDTHSLDDCSALDTLSDVDYSKLYTWIIKQIRLLESLYLITLQM